tara:strand:- start:5104 stop:5307 length:204 start_codon:yes stop_codon:yes gene_type:complete
MGGKEVCICIHKDSNSVLCVGIWRDGGYYVDSEYRNLDLMERKDVMYYHECTHKDLLEMLTNQIRKL